MSTETTPDERIEELREHVKDGYIDTFVTEEALAIIDELRAKRDDFRQQCADLIGKTNRQAVRIDELEAENERLKDQARCGHRWFDVRVNGINMLRCDDCNFEKPRIGSSGP